MSLEQLQIDRERLSQELSKLAAISDAPAPAVTRIHFTKTELAGRAYVRNLAREAGLQIHEDAIGNIFMRWVGREPDLPAVATGSHIDAVPFSGQYDGTVGVLGGLEAIRALKSVGYEPRRSIDLILFTAEEPTRFGIGCLGSRTLAGQLTAVQLQQLRDPDGQSFEQARQQAGYTTPLDQAPLHLEPGNYKAFIELHIEQGSLLEEQGVPIGIVTTIAAPATIHVDLHGDGGHAGGMLMGTRRDALLPAAEIVLAVEQAAQQYGTADAVATTGVLKLHPGAVNSIPSHVHLEIDLRDVDLAHRDEMVRQVEQAIHDTAEKRRIQAEWRIINADPPVTCAEEIITAVTRLAKQQHLGHHHLVSRAYHDTLFMSRICPSGMIFIPSKQGYGHRPEEYSTPQQIAQGVKLLALTLAHLANGV